MSKLQLQNKYLENALVTFRQRLKELSETLSKSELERLLAKYGVKDICEMPQTEMNGGSLDDNIPMMNGSKTPDSGIDVNSSGNDEQLLIETSVVNNNNSSFVPSVPPRNFHATLNNSFDALKPSVGTKLEGLLLNSDSDSDFDPRASESETIVNNNSNGNNMNDMFGFEPPKTLGQQLFNFNSTNGSHNGNNGYVNGSPASPPPLRMYFQLLFDEL